MHKNSFKIIVCLSFVMAGVLLLILSLRKPGPQETVPRQGQEQVEEVARDSSTGRPESVEGQGVRSYESDMLERTATSRSQPVMESGPGMNASVKGPVQGHLSDKETEARSPSLGIASFSGSTVSGGAIIAGGWEESDGSRTFCFTSPRELVNSPNGGLQVSYIVLNIPVGSSIDPTWNPLLESDEKGIHRNTLSHDAEQYAELLRSLNANQFSILSSPSVIVADGEHASLSLTSKDRGVLFSVVPTKNAANGEINVSVSVARYEGLDPLSKAEGEE